MSMKKLSVVIVGLFVVALAGSAQAGAVGFAPEGVVPDKPAVDEAVSPDVANSVSDADGETMSSRQLPNAYAYGKTYGEWSAKWWQWALEIPASRNPIKDQTGEDADVGQERHRQVWFLAGTSAGSAERSVSVPKHRSLLFTIVKHYFIK